MQGSKLGNGFKWSTIKNIINYEQERDRQRIHETNARSEYTINKLRAGGKHAQANRANTPGGTERYGKLPDKTSNPELFIYRPSFTAQIIRAAFAEADRKTERAVDGAINSVLKIPKACPTSGGSSRLKRYLTPTVVGIIAALLTNLIWWIAS